MPDDSPSRRPRLENLNWLGKTVAAGGALMRLTAQGIEATAARVATLAEQSKEEFERARDPNIEEARVVEEYDASSPSQASSPPDDAT